MSNFVYLATSLDGYIARNDGSVDWLDRIEHPAHDDYGFEDFIRKIDAIVMGKNTFQFVKSSGAWPYTKPVFVLSSTLKPQQNKSAGYEIMADQPAALVKKLRARGYHQLYIDGGKTIRSFLACALIDEMIITVVPLLLGCGRPLFGKSDHEIKLKHMQTRTYQNGLVQNHYQVVK